MFDRWHHPNGPDALDEIEYCAYCGDQVVLEGERMIGANDDVFCSLRCADEWESAFLTRVFAAAYEAKLAYEQALWLGTRRAA